jgi:Phage integrase, N-terminal SAM-like domain
MQSVEQLDRKNFHCAKAGPEFLLPVACKIIPRISGPSLIGKQDLARRRYQRGALRREGKNWILRWREDVLNKVGRVVRVERRARVGATKDLPTKALARRVADRMIEHVNEPNYMPGKVAAVQEFAETYRANVCPTFKPSTCESTRSLCRIYIEPPLGPYRLDQVKGEVSQLLVNELRRRGLSRKTILNALSALASMPAGGSGLELPRGRTRLEKAAFAGRGTPETVALLHTR